MKEKFKKYTFVHTHESPYVEGKRKVDFTVDFDAIIRMSYAQEYGGKQNKIYSVYQLKNNKIIGLSAWHEEDEITALTFQDRNKAIKMVRQCESKFGSTE